MKFIHTSDWHLGQIFMGKSREEEHKLFLEWLLEKTDEEKAEVLIVAGDIFDTATPPVYAQKLYFNFLSKLSKTSCKKAIITAGNHDSVSLLEASKDILSFLNVEVITKEAKIIEFEDTIFITVPFLREKYLLKAIKNKTAKENEERFINAIKEYYNSLYQKVKESQKTIIATGHLSVIGSEGSGSEREIYIGNLSSVDGDFFEKRFDYTALGHFHKKQFVKKSVAYSGSPIPLNFKEASFSKSIFLVETENKKVSVKKIKIPSFKNLVSLELTSLDIEKLFNDTPKNSWAEVIVKTKDKGEFLYEEIEEKAKEKEIEVLAIKYQNLNDSPSFSTEDENIFIENLTPIKVFQKRMEQEELTDETRQKLENLFLEIATEVELGMRDEDK